MRCSESCAAGPRGPQSARSNRGGRAKKPELNGALAARRFATRAGGSAARGALRARGALAEEKGAARSAGGAGAVEAEAVVQGAHGGLDVGVGDEARDLDLAGADGLDVDAGGGEQAEHLRGDAGV